MNDRLCARGLCMLSFAFYSQASIVAPTQWPHCGGGPLNAGVSSLPLPPFPPSVGLNRGMKNSSLIPDLILEAGLSWGLTQMLRGRRNELHRKESEVDATVIILVFLP